MGAGCLHHVSVCSTGGSAAAIAAKAKVQHMFNRMCLLLVLLEKPTDPCVKESRGMLPQLLM